MSCPRPEDLDLYLENELDDAADRALERHLDGCPVCRARIEERKVFLAALREFPAIEIPADFTARVMAEVFPERKSAFGWLVAVIGGILGLFLGGIGYILATGQNLQALALDTGKTLFGSGRAGMLIMVKIGKLALLSLDLMIRFAESCVVKIGRLGALIDTRIYVVLGVALVAVSALVYLAVRKRILRGEKP